MQLQHWIVAVTTGKPCWLHPQKNSPEVDHRPVGTITYLTFLVVENPS